MTRIVTAAIYPPVPTTEFDWQATFDWFDGDDDQPVGLGATEDDAVLDLMQNATEFDDDGSCIEELINMAFAGWKSKPQDATPVQNRSYQGERATRPGALLPDAPGPFPPLDQRTSTEIAIRTYDCVRKDAQ